MVANYGFPTNMSPTPAEGMRFATYRANVPTKRGNFSITSGFGWTDGAQWSRNRHRCERAFCHQIATPASTLLGGPASALRAINSSPFSRIMVANWGI